MPVDWEERYRQGDMPWEKGAPSPGLLEYLAANPPPAGRILVPGCGFGHDVRALSRPDNEVAGLDIAPSALHGAAGFPKTGRETYLLGDLFNLPSELRASFDWVWEHTCFCAIDPAMRPDYARAVASALKPGGRLLAVFYPDPGNEDEGPPYGVTLAELDSIFSAAFVLEREWMPGKTYPGREGREWMRLLKRRPEWRE
jgi:SAM-dependent methyltransferase